MNYKILDMDKYYRKGVYNHFTKDVKCSVSMTYKVDVTALYAFSKRTGTKFSINFLYVLSVALNSREDYRTNYLFQTGEVVVYDEVNPIQYVFDEKTETCTPVYTKFYKSYQRFYDEALKDLENAKKTGGYHLAEYDHPNYFDASFIPWVSYESMNIELPDGYFYFLPIVNWGKYREENGKLMMPVTIRMNHAIADGYLISKAFLLIEEQIAKLSGQTL